MICAYCCADVYFLTTDHITPKSKSHSLENNKIKVCFNCNQLKGDMMPNEFVEALSLLIKRNIATRNFNVRELMVIRANFTNILKNYHPIPKPASKQNPPKPKQCHSPFNNVLDKIEVKSKKDFPIVSPDCRFMYEVEIFLRPEESEEGYWKTEIRYYRHSKTNQDFDLHYIEGRRRNARFIGMKPTAIRKTV